MSNFFTGSARNSNFLSVAGINSDCSQDLLPLLKKHLSSKPDYKAPLV